MDDLTDLTRVAVERVKGVADERHAASQEEARARARQRRKPAPVETTEEQTSVEDDQDESDPHKLDITI